MTPAPQPALAVPPDVAQGSNLHSQNLFLTGKNSADCVAACTAENSGIENFSSTAPRVSKVWYDYVTHPAGASRTAVVIHEYINWTDGAQTARAGFSGGWLCVHPGAGWPDALEACQHIELLGGAK